jgi:hypothetical protein
MSRRLSLEVSDEFGANVFLEGSFIKVFAAAIDDDGMSIRSLDGCKIAHGGTYIDIVYMYVP